MAGLKKVLIVLFFLALGGVLVFAGGKQIAEGFASRNWLPTQGTIIDSHVASGTVTKKSGNTRRTTTEYTTTIRYTYTVGEREYTGNRLTVESSGYTGTNRSSAYDLAGRYPVGVAVVVHYDPRDPSTAVLRAGAAGFGSWILVSLGLLILAGTGIVVRAISRPAPAPNVVLRVPPAQGFGADHSSPAVAPSHRTATPVGAAVQNWQSGAVPRGVITDWTARFLGPAETWDGAQVSVSNLHGLWGGRHILLTGAGRTIVRLSPLPQEQQLHELALTPNETHHLLGLFAQHDFLTITFPARALTPDEGGITLTLRNAYGQEFTLTRHDHDLDEGGRFAAIATPLLALADRVAAAQPSTDAALAARYAAGEP